jgi:hypothetical protein
MRTQWTAGFDVEFARRASNRGLVPLDFPIRQGKVRRAIDRIAGIAGIIATKLEIAG